MKKLTVYAMMAVGMGAWADDNAPGALGGHADEAERVDDALLLRNHLTNGDFEASGIERRMLIGYDGMDTAYECLAIPGWEIETGGLRNGIVEILTHGHGEGQYARMRHYTADGWARITLTATATGLTPGREHVLDMYVCHSHSDSNPWAMPDHGFKIYGKDGRLQHFNHAVSDGPEWQYVRYAFTPADDEVTLELWSQNYNGDGNVSGVHTVSWDDVRIYDPQVDGLLANPSDTPPTQYYTLQGQPVTNPGPGIYLAKRGAAVAKIIIQ